MTNLPMLFSCDNLNNLYIMLVDVYKVSLNIVDTIFLITEGYLVKYIFMDRKGAIATH